MVGRRDVALQRLLDAYPYKDVALQRLYSTTKSSGYVILRLNIGLPCSTDTESGIRIL